jgi:hypothetical protein
MRTLVPTMTTTTTRTDRSLARQQLRAQIARLERELSDAVIAGAPIPPHASRGAGPRMLGLAALEAERDALTADVAAARAVLADEAERQEHARRRLEAMLLAPGEHRFERVALTELGEGGCGVYMVRPRLGLIGMLAGWWQVKLSSGCPLCGCVRRWSSRPPRRCAAPRPRRRPPRRAAESTSPSP